VNEDSSYLDILYNISRELAGSLELHEVLTRVLILAARNMDAERASLILLNQTGKPIDAVVLYHGEVTSTDPSFIKNISRTGLAGWVKRNRKPALVADTQQDHRWIDRLYDGKVVREPKSALCVPIMTKQQLKGMLTLVHPQVNYFNNGHLQLLQRSQILRGLPFTTLCYFMIWRKTETYINVYLRVSRILSWSPRLMAALSKSTGRLVQPPGITGASWQR